MIADLAILTPYIYRLIKPEEDYDSEPDTYYRSFQPDGGVIMRRVSDLAPEMRQEDPNCLPAARPPDVGADVSSTDRESKTAVYPGVLPRQSSLSSHSGTTGAHFEQIEPSF